MRKSNLTLALLLAASTLALTGCSRNPVAPELNAPSDPGAAPAVAGGVEEDKDPGVVGEGGADGSLHVESMEAGVLHVGRWSLTVHKNSHLDAATISMTVPDRNSMEVQIEVFPASANVFQVPIELVADCSDQPNLLPEENGIFLWNGDWTLAEDQTVQAGALVFKAKATHLSNAKVASTLAVVGGKGKK